MSFYKSPEFNNIFLHYSFEKELSKLFGKSKALYKEYQLWLNEQLSWLDEVGYETAQEQFPLIFEAVQPHTIELFAIRSTFEGNPRIIFFKYIDKDDGEIDFLLYPFLEKNTSADYKRASDIAQNRKYAIIKELEELNNGN